ncbi:winged helix-turn-helix transcriptional regulator [Kribbella sp. NPDC058245]|uniref:winged helix-turn-helix transcriptional regulator n=1 Tax=Kribbella sp. NPDC058245 TaxID=3346399 RepID=UPI0036E76BBA
MTDSVDHPAVAPRACPVAASLEVLGERWTLLAIRELSYGVHRFDQIVRNTGASRDKLADRLRKLAAAGVIERRQYSERPPRFEYHLTAAGEELRPVLLGLALWGDKWVFHDGESAATHSCGHGVEIDYRCRHCGEAVSRENIDLVGS